MLNILIGAPASGKTRFLSSLPSETIIFDDFPRLRPELIRYSVERHSFSKKPIWFSAQDFRHLPKLLRESPHNLFHVHDGHVSLVSKCFI